MSHVDDIGNSAHGAEVGLAGNCAEDEGQGETTPDNQRGKVDAFVHSCSGGRRAYFAALTPETWVNVERMFSGALTMPMNCPMPKDGHASAMR